MQQQLTKEQRKQQEHINTKLALADVSEELHSTRNGLKETQELLSEVAGKLGAQDANGVHAEIDRLQAFERATLEAQETKKPIETKDVKEPSAGKGK